MTSQPKATIRKISKTEYEVIATGERREFALIPECKQIVYIKKSMRRLNELIRANFDTVSNATNACFLTLTYAGANMTDTEKLYIDVDRFIKRLKRAFPAHKLDYISICEPHESGGWHVHMLVKSDRPHLFIDYRDLTVWQYEKDPNDPEKDYIDPETGFRKLYKNPVTGENVILGGIWGHGRVTSVRLKSDDAGAYYCAYFSNAETTASVHDASHVDVDPHDDPEAVPKSKKFQKGDRLRFYPAYFKFYRASRGIIRPKPEKMLYADVPKELGKPVRTFTHEIGFEDDPDSLSFYTLQSMQDTGQHITPDDIEAATQTLRDRKATLNTVQRQVYKKNQTLSPNQQGSKQKKKPKG
jgi:hypothetical protein